MNRRKNQRPQPQDTAGHPLALGDRPTKFTDIGKEKSIQHSDKEVPARPAKGANQEHLALNSEPNQPDNTNRGGSAPLYDENGLRYDPD